MKIVWSLFRELKCYKQILMNSSYILVKSKRISSNKIDTLLIYNWSVLSRKEILGGITRTDFLGIKKFCVWVVVRVGVCWQHMQRKKHYPNTCVNLYNLKELDKTNKICPFNDTYGFFSESWLSMKLNWIQIRNFR